MFDMTSLVTLVSIGSESLVWHNPYLEQMSSVASRKSSIMWGMPLNVMAKSKMSWVWEHFGKHKLLSSLKKSEAF